MEMTGLFCCFYAIYENMLLTQYPGFCEYKPGAASNWLWGTG